MADSDKSKKVRVTITLKPEEYEAVTEMAEETNRTVSAMIGQLIKESKEKDKK